MRLTYDDTLQIAVGHAATSKIWKNQKITWSDFVKRIGEGIKTSETYKEYIKATKEEQLKIKDVGGYVGGYLRNGRRKPENVIHRQLVTLDIDFAHINFWEDFMLFCPNAAILHSTHKHSETSPRFRLIMPLDREVTSDEYVAISRKIAGDFGIDLFDNTTFETNRLMFWPSYSTDADYVFAYQDGPWVSADEVLDSYSDWTDSSLWPTSTRELKRVKDLTAKQEDPESKIGIVGAFCRALDIHEAIKEYLTDIYENAGEDRYTYAKGSTTGGLLTYEDKFAFSHHGTDPCSGRLCNAFDLVRIHKFGHLDEDEYGNITEKSESFKKMADLASSNREVKKIIAKEKLEEAKYDFSTDFESEADDIEWMTELEVDKRNKYLPTAHNLKLIFENDPRLKSAFKFNSFDGKSYVFTSLPWRRITEPEPIKNVDYSGVRVYIETVYGIVSGGKIEDALLLTFERNSFHPVREFLSKLEWDKKPRLDNLLVDFFGTPDEPFYRESIRKCMVGAVVRVFNPGCKFDYVLTLVGPQGTGKSTFLKKLGKSWFSDTFLTVQGKEALEQIQGAWIIEMAELSGLRKAEVESIKHFITKQEDTFRPAYARTSETYKRQCVFFGTTNNKDFLTDPTGNRRFLPIDVDIDNVILSVFDDMDEDFIDQLWAEAYHLYRRGERLTMSPEADVQAKAHQLSHTESDERLGLIENFLDMKLPANWEKLGVEERRMVIENPNDVEGVIVREFVCVPEIWCELLGRSKSDMSRFNTRDLNNVMKALDKWVYCNSPRNFENYGRQKYYRRRK